ncbi:hypothetical protein PHMEG_00036131 [Phytophthora megakarya]|uniref:Uncharacterized protein n=1 Tax=Phytophthora megakarya TaxID=4795 RepID=A0A225UQ02_9STRA|nr:hypothetical protein PHMEG_00036131 [Phytophthora megakarya]
MRRLLTTVLTSIVGVSASVAALRGGARVYPGHGGLEVLLCFESLDATDLQDLNRLMGGDAADCLPFLRPRVAPASLAAEVGSIAGQRELAALLGQFPLDRLAERMINSFSFIRRLLAKIRHLQAASDAERSGTLSPWWLTRISTPCVASGPSCADIGASAYGPSSELALTARTSSVKGIVTLSPATKRSLNSKLSFETSETARQAAERRAEERVLDVNALVDFLMGNKPKINVMFNWVRLSALLHHFAEGTPIPEGWLTNINVVALDDPRCECPEYVFPKTRQRRLDFGFFASTTSKCPRPVTSCTQEEGIDIWVAG